MTACVNRKHTKKVAAVVTASLVGALSLGAAPVAAVADTGIDMLVAGDQEDIANGKITAYTDQDGRTISSTEFSAGKNQYIIPTEVTTKTGQVLDVAKDDLDVFYYTTTAIAGATADKLADGTEVYFIENADDISAAGTYYVGVGVKGVQGAANLTTLKFTLVNESLSGATVVDGTDVDDSVIEYTGSKQFLADDFNIALNGEIVSSDNYTAQIFKKGSSTGESDGITDAGDYIVRLVGKDKYAGSTVDVAFSIVAADLTNAEIVLDGATSALVGTAVPTSVVSIDGEAGLVDDVKFEFVSSSNGSLAPSTAKGSYTYKVSPAKADDANVVSSQEITVIRYEKNADIEYDGNAMTGQSVKDFDPAKISVKGGKEDVDYKVSYAKKDSNGNWVGVSADEIGLPGDYKATVTATDSTFTYGGEGTVEFTVDAVQINDKDIFVTYNGKVTGDTLEVTYDGSDFLSKLEISATDAEGDEVPAGELVLKAKNEDNEDVSEVVNAGTYEVTVAAKEGSMYKVVGDQTFTIEVSPITAVKAVVNGTVTNEDGAKFLPYTGSVINPTFTFEDKDGNVIEIPAEAYKVSYEGTTGNALGDTEVKEIGAYNVTFSNTVDTVNYDVTWCKSDVVTVSEAKSFADVANDSWYVGPVYQAKVNKYINGYSGTALYGPERSISRADVVCVLFNMAAGSYGSDQYVAPEGSTDSVSFPTDFSDCDETAYYAGALAWAAKAGVVNGYDDGTFKPEQTITREEFACMLANFAKLKGDFQASADADATLAAYDDASTVSDWAAENVAWAVESDIMGNGGFLNANGDINRAEVAAMAVNYQPEKL